MVSVSALNQWLKDNYDLPTVLDIKLLRAYTNDVYLVELRNSRFIVKLYRQNWRTREEILYEIDLVQFLADRGLPSAPAITGFRGETVNPIQTAAGTRFGVLFEYAAGAKPQPPFSSALYEKFGEAVGRLHRLSAEFSSPHPRRSIDLDYLVNEPLRLVKSHLSGQPAALAYLAQTAERVKDRVLELHRPGLDWGPIHGDATLDNLHVNDDQQVVLFDFDSGGPGWRASDLQGWAVRKAEYAEKHHSFIRGYRRAHSLNERDIEASPYLTVAWDMWGMKVELEQRVIRQGQAAVDAYLAEAIAVIKQRELP